MKFVLSLLLGLVMLVCGLGAAPKQEAVLFTNGTFYLTTDATAKNLLVVNGKVAGSDVDATKYPQAKVIDLKGAYVYPGFHDSHCHLLETGMAFSGANLFGCTDAEQIAQKLAPVVAKVPKGQPVIGVGFHLHNYDAWSLKDLAVIDKAAGNHPLILVDNLGHNCMVNSLVLKKYNIKADSKVGPAGTIVSENGKPTGMLRESAMLLPGVPMMKMFSDQMISDGFMKLAKTWNPFGYTHITDLMGCPMGQLMRPQIFKKLEKQGKLPLRVDYDYTMFSLKEMPNALPYRGKDTDLVRFAGFKTFIDGAVGAGQAWTSWKNLQGNHGEYYLAGDDKTFGPEYNLNRIAAKAEDLKLCIQYHVQGDAGIETILKALEKIKAKKGKLEVTHTLIHMAFPTPEQLKRIKALGDKVVITTQPGLWEAEADMGNYYGPHTKYAYPLKSMMASGISTGFSTDFSVSPIAIAPPLAVVGIAADPEKYGFEADQALTPKDIVKGFTIGSALTVPKHDTGTLEKGKWADMVVTGEDIITTKPDQAAKIKILSTWVGGKKVYDIQEAEKTK